MTSTTHCSARRAAGRISLAALTSLAMLLPAVPAAFAAPSETPSPTPSASEEPSASPSPEPSETPAQEDPAVDETTAPEADEDALFDDTLADALPVAADQGNEAMVVAPQPRDMAGVYVASGSQVGHGWVGSRTIFPGDWNRDNSSDLMLITADGKLLYYRTLMPDTFTPPVQIGQNWGAAIEVVGGADWDGDGNTDLIGRFVDGTLHLYQGNGRGGFLGQRQIGRNWHNFSEIAVIQKGRNGRPSLVGLRNDGYSFVYTSNTRVEFSDAVASAIDWVGFRNLVGTGDWDNNGRGDLLTIDADNNLRYLAADSSGNHFSHYKVGKNWGSMQRLQSARIHGKSYVFGISNTGALWIYPLVNKERASDPAPRVDKRCLTGRVLCASKADRILYWMIDGKIQAAMDARFGKADTPSDNGQFRVYWKSRWHFSTIYHVDMPWAMFYNGGEAVHYSAGFAQAGWHGGSGGCVNVRDKVTLDWVYRQVRVGDKVVVY